MKKYILAWDEGTTSTRAILFDREAKIMAISQKEFSQFYPEPGWVEQDPMEIWSSQIGVATEVLARANARPEDIAAIGITNQRETTLVWDKKTGQPVYNAIGWQCRRTAPLCTQLEKDGYKDLLQEKTGLILDPYFSATKIRWILDHIEDGQGRAERGELLFGTIDTWLIWRLTDGEVHVTDYSNASRTMLLNIHDLDWDREILDILHIPRVMLPEVRPSSEVYGHSHTRFFGTPIPIGAAVGDQQGALFGQACFTKGDVKSTYGTGAFILLNTGDQAVHSKNGLVTTLAWGLEPGKVTYALEGSIFVSGASIKWLRDQVRMIDSAEDTEYIATKVNSTDGLYVVPAFTGLGAPYWDPNARGLIIGITLGTTKKHIIRATLEAQAYLTNDVLESMIDDAQIAINEIKVDGGASRNNFMMQSLADISRVRVERPQTLESSALGAAFLAGLAVDFWSGLDELEKMWDLDRVYDCRMHEKNRNRKLRNWHQAVKRARNWAEDYEPWEE